MQRTILSSLLFSAALLNATPIVTLGGTNVAGEGQYTARPGVTTVNFNSGAPVSGVLAYTLSASNLVTGNLASQYAAPTGDTTQYLTVGPSAGSPVSIQSTILLSYFGFYASSVDTYNTILFYRDAALVLTLDGSTLATLGGFQANGQISTFVNIDASGPAEFFNRIVLTSSSNAFESDNHAFGQAAAIPEPQTGLVVGGLGALLLLFGTWKRRR